MDIMHPYPSWLLHQIRCSKHHDLFVLRHVSRWETRRRRRRRTVLLLITMATLENARRDAWASRQPYTRPQILPDLCSFVLSCTFQSFFLISSFLFPTFFSHLFPNLLQFDSFSGLLFLFSMNFLLAGVKGMAFTSSPGLPCRFR